MMFSDVIKKASNSYNNKKTNRENPCSSAELAVYFGSSYLFYGKFDYWILFVNNRPIILKKNTDMIQ